MYIQFKLTLNQNFPPLFYRNSIKRYMDCQRVDILYIPLGLCKTQSTSMSSLWTSLPNLLFICNFHKRDETSKLQRFSTNSWKELWKVCKFTILSFHFLKATNIFLLEITIMVYSLVLPISLFCFFVRYLFWQ